MNENGTVEAIEPDIETTPEAGGLIATSRESVEDLYYLADNIEKMISAQNKIRLAVLKLAQPGDWVTFGKEDKEKAEIGFAGALRIGSTLGVSFTNWESKKETGRDDIGEWYRWEFECDSVFRGRIVRVYGRAGSRDKFFGKDKGEFKEIHDIDEGNIKMAARRAAMKEGVKVLFGLHHMDPTYLKANGVKLASAGGYAFKSTDEKAAETQNITEIIKDAILAKSGKKANGQAWNLYKITMADGSELATFSDTEHKKAVEFVKSGQVAQVNFKINDKGSKVIESIIGF